MKALFYAMWIVFVASFNIAEYNSSFFEESEALNIHGTLQVESFVRKNMSDIQNVVLLTLSK